MLYDFFLCLFFYELITPRDFSKLCDQVCMYVSNFYKIVSTYFLSDLDGVNTFGNYTKSVLLISQHKIMFIEVKYI